MLEQIAVSAREATRAVREGLLSRPLWGFGMGFFDAAATRQYGNGLSFGSAQVSSRFCILVCGAMVVNALRNGEALVLTPGFMLGFVTGAIAEAVYDQASQFAL